MKYLLIFTLLTACHRMQSPSVVTPMVDTDILQAIPMKDTVVYPMPSIADNDNTSVKYRVLAERYDSLAQVNESQLLEINALRYTRDTLSTQLFLNRYKVEKVRFYLNICLKNSTQDKFLKGWIRRAIN